MITPYFYFYELKLCLKIFYIFEWKKIQKTYCLKKTIFMEIVFFDEFHPKKNNSLHIESFSVDKQQQLKF